MATSASIDLVFNAKDNTRSAFQGVSRELNQVKTVADRASAGFVSLGQSVQDVGQKSTIRLKQGFLTAGAVIRQAFEVGIAGAVALSGALARTGQSTIAFARIFQDYIINPLTSARSFLDNKSFLDVYIERIIAASAESVSFRSALKAVGDSTDELIRKAAKVDLRKAFQKPEAPPDYSKLSPEAREAKFTEVKSINQQFGLPEPKDIEQGLRQIKRYEQVLERKKKAEEAQELGTITATTRQLGLPDPRTIEAGVAALERYDARLKLQFAAIADGATVTDRFRGKLVQLTQSVEKAARSLYDGFLPALGGVLDRTREVDKKISGSIDKIGSVSVGIGGLLKSTAGYDEAIASFDGLRKGAGAFAEGVGAISQQIFFFQSAFQSIGQLVSNGPFRLLIGQQAQLRQQLLETQSTLVATNKIIDARTGEQINRPAELGGDPGRAISALSGATEAAIDQLRKDSLELVGVTSSQLAEVFNITTTNLAATGVDSKNLLSDAADLTIKFSAALGTIGLPLFQARQEISSILQGTIDQNSVLAKTLNLTNSQITKYKEQGTLLEKLNEKLKPFQAGNAIAAKSLEGVTSNIKEVFEVVSLQAGKPLLDPLLEGLGRFYQFLSKNQATFLRFLEPVIQNILRVQNAIFGAGEAIGSSLGPVIGQLFSGIVRAVANFAEQFASAISTTLTLLQPFVAILSSLAAIFNTNKNSFGAVIIQLVVFGKTIQALGTSLNLFLNLINGVGEIRYIIDVFTTGAIAQFSKLKSTFSTTTSAALTFGLNLEQLASRFPIVNNQLSRMLGGFKVFAPVVANLVPKISALFLALAGLPAAFKGIGDAIAKGIPKIAIFLEQFALLGRVVSFVAGKIVTSIFAIQAALTSAGFADVAAKLDDIALAFANLEVGNFAKGAEGIGGVFTAIGEKAEVGLKKADNAIAKVAGGKIGGLSKEVIASAVSFGLWAIAIAGAGVALSEFLQRRKDGGADIKQLSTDLETQTKALRGIDNSQVEALNGSMKDSSALAKDWVDKIILLDRNFSLSTLSFKNFGEALISIGKVITVVFTRIAVFVMGTLTTLGTLWGNFTGIIVKTFQATAKSLEALISGLTDLLLKPVTIMKDLSTGIALALAGDFEGARKSFANIFSFSDKTNELAAGAKKAATGTVDAWKVTVEDAKQGVAGTLEDTFVTGLDGVQTKVEKSAADLTKAALDPAFLNNAKEFGKAVREELIPGDEEFKQIGEQISRTFSAIGQEGSEAGDRLASVSQAMDLVKKAGKTGIIDNATVEESIQLIQDFRDSALTSGGALKDSSEKGKEAFDQQITSLRQGLSIALQQGRNITLGVKSDDAQKKIDLITDSLTKLEDLQKVDFDPAREDAIGRLRRARAELEGVVETIATLRQDTQPLPDPVQLYANAIAQGEKDLKKEQAKLTLEQQEATAATIGSFLEKRGEGELVFTRRLEAEKAAINKKAIEGELAKTQEVIAKIEAERANLTEFELERAKESDEQLNQLKTRFAQKQIELFEAEIAEQQRVRDEAERNIQELLTQTENAIKTTTLGIKEQEIAYDGVLQKLEQQNKILEEGKRLVAAQTESATAGLEFLAASARGEARQKTIAEATAAIRLQAVREQLKFDEISFNLEEQKTQLALEREAIAANIAQLEAEAGLARAQAEQEKVALNPEATAAERKAAELEVRSQAFQLKAAQQSVALTQDQLAQSQALSALRRQAFEQESENKEFAARRAAAEAIASPTARRAAIRSLEEEQRVSVAQRIGLDPASFNDAASFGRELRGANRQFREGEFGVAPGASALEILETFVPGLSDLTGEARTQATDRAIRLASQAGAFLNPSAITATSPALGQEFRLQTSQSSVFQQLLSPVQSTLGLAAEGIGKAAQGFDSLITEMRAIAAKPTYSVTVTAGAQSLSSTGTGSNQSVDLQKVLATAKRLVSNGLF